MKKGIIKLGTGLLTVVILATTLVAPVFAAEKNVTETKPATTENAPITPHFSTDDDFKRISSMEIKDSAKRARRDIAVKHDKNCWCYSFIKRYLQQKGPNLAFVLGIYFIPSPVVYEMIQLMEHEIEEGNSGYIYNGQYYDSPAEDPNFLTDINR